MFIFAMNRPLNRNTHNENQHKECLLTKSKRTQTKSLSISCKCSEIATYRRRNVFELSLTMIEHGRYRRMTAIRLSGSCVCSQRCSVSQPELISCDATDSCWWSRDREQRTSCTINWRDVMTHRLQVPGKLLPAQKPRKLAHQARSQDFCKGGHDDGGTEGPERGAKRRWG